LPMQASPSSNCWNCSAVRPLSLSL
jgi:hypothetical protein